MPDTANSAFTASGENAAVISAVKSPSPAVNDTAPASMIARSDSAFSPVTASVRSAYPSGAAIDSNAAGESVRFRPGSRISSASPAKETESSVPAKTMRIAFSSNTTDSS